MRSVCLFAVSCTLFVATGYCQSPYAQPANPGMNHQLWNASVPTPAGYGNAYAPQAAPMPYGGPYAAPTWGAQGGCGMGACGPGNCARGGCGTGQCAAGGCGGGQGYPPYAMGGCGSGAGAPMYGVPGCGACDGGCGMAYGATHGMGQCPRPKSGMNGKKAARMAAKAVHYPMSKCVQKAHHRCACGGCGCCRCCGSGGGAVGPEYGVVNYPYYTTRGPRDFLMVNPPSIGP